MSGPANDSTLSWRGDDGRWHHTIRQSSLSKFLHMCPESLRADMHGETTPTTSSAAAIGTAVHAAIEHTINHVFREGHEAVDADERQAAIVLALATYNDIASGTEGFFVDTHGSKAFDLIRAAYAKWSHDVLPTLQPVATELTFKDILLWEDEQRSITLNGTIDFVDARLGLIDWKTAARPYQQWEKQRWDVQSSAYLYAAKHLGIDVADKFTFCVLVHGKDVQWLTVKRDATNEVWFKQQCLSYAYMCEASLPMWPLNDGGWWCSPKFCNNYTKCRGTWGDHTA